MARPAKKVELTDFYLKKLASEPADPGGRKIIWDAIQHHLGVRITDKGHRSFVVFRRRAGGKMVNHKLGTYPTLSLKDARIAAAEALKVLAAGKTPKEVEEEREREQARRRKDTFASVAEEFIKRYLPKLRSAKATEAQIRRELIDRWRDRAITEIMRRDVIEMVEAIVDRGAKRNGNRRAGGPNAARKALAAARKLFNWALHRDVYGLDVSPCAGIKTADAVGATKARDRVLTDGELFLVWRATKKMGRPFGPLFRTLLLNGQRLNEIARARWPEIEPTVAVLTVPAERMKGKEAHSVPLTPRAVAILEALPRFAADKRGPNDFLFTTTGGKRPVSGFSKAKRRLDREIDRTRAALVRLGRRRGRDVTVPPVPPFTLHDLRRTVRTRLSELKVLPVVAEMVIGHKQQGIHAVYDVHTYDAEKRDALMRWERMLLGVVDPAPAEKAASKVVPMRRRKRS